MWALNRPQKARASASAMGTPSTSTVSVGMGKTMHQRPRAVTLAGEIRGKVGDVSARVGVGTSRNRKPELAGREAVRAALEPLGETRPAFVLVFATTGYDQQALLAALASEVPPGTPISGCSAAGVITHAGSDEGSHVVGVTAVAAEGLRARVLASADARADATECGRDLARRIRASGTGDDRIVLLFSEGLRCNAAGVVRGLEEGLERLLPIVGGCAGDALTFSETFQYDGAQPRSGAATALVLSGDLAAEVAVGHGCEPFALEEQITRADNGWVHEIGDRPAWAFFKEYLGELDSLDALSISYLCLAQRIEQTARGYGDYVIRVPLELDKESGSLFFPGALEMGARVHVARRRPERIVSNAKTVAMELAARRERRPDVMLQFDCVGRGRLMFGEATTQRLIAPVQKAVGGDVPWLGLHTFGEIAPVASQTHFHNFTVALCALYLGS